MIKELQLDGFKLSYTSEGEGSDVLLLHGFPSNMFFWNNIKNDLKNMKEIESMVNGIKDNNNRRKDDIQRSKWFSNSY